MKTLILDRSLRKTGDYLVKLPGVIAKDTMSAKSRRWISSVMA